MRWIIMAIAVAVSSSGLRQACEVTTAPQPLARSYRLHDLSWQQAEQVLMPDTLVLIPLGAGTLEHGPHLKLRSDQVLAEHLTTRAAAATSVVVAPTLTYHYYPAFLEYPGSTSLSLNSARDSTFDVVRSLARFGPRRFYVLNTGLTTLPSLAAAARALATDGILLRYTDWESRLDLASRGLREQETGNHADEIETSMLLHVDSNLVDMTRAVRESAPRSNPFVLSRRPGAAGTYSASGTWGDPTRATAEKGRVLLDAVTAGIVGELEATRTAALPTSDSGGSQPTLTERPPFSPETPGTPMCSEGDLRTIRAIGDAFAAHWANGDAVRLGELWTPNGDIVHPDATVERGSAVITQNRFELFKRREYRNSRHPMQAGNIRRIADGVAIADGKWELRGLTDVNSKILPSLRGLFSMIVERSGVAWRIIAYRYTIDPAGPAAPTLLKRPGYPGGLD